MQYLNAPNWKKVAPIGFLRSNSDKIQKDFTQNQPYSIIILYLLQKTQKIAV